jgi:enoyl-CoA hydratase
VIVTDRTGPVGVVTIDRHHRRNALDEDHCRQLDQGFATVVADGCRAVVITGAGTSFCAGADLDGVYGENFRAALYQALRRVAESDVPVLAAVNGPAVGAGLQLALACDLRVASDRAHFALPTARHGLAVDPWTIRRLALLAGGGAARCFLLGGGRLDAALAYQRGLVDAIGETADAMAWAGEISAMAPASLAYSKLALRLMFEPPGWDAALDEAFARCWSGADAAEGRRARREGRSPQFGAASGPRTPN